MYKKRVLIVDDNTDISNTLKINLEMAGQYDVRVENRSVKARQSARQFKPDIILLDVIMPEKDGGMVAAELEADSELRKVPIIFLTSIVDREEAARKGGRLGNAPLLAKPFTMNELLPLIEKCCAGASTPTSAPR